MKKNLYIPIFLAILFLVSCQQKGTKEGELIYQITYLQTEDQNPLIALLPKTISVKFKESNTLANIDGFFGTFNLKIITNRNDKKNYTALRILDKRFIAETPLDSISAAYENLNILQVIEKPQDTATFAGLVSYQIEIVYGQLTDSIINFYCTNDIKIDDPNANSPFFQIKGVLTRFQTKVAGIDMIFELKEFKEKKIDASEFVPPEGYKQVSGQEIKELLKSFQQ